MIIAVHNHKGGIGKTTISAHLAWRANDLGIRCLALTLDRQGDLLRWFVPEPSLKKPCQNGLITGLCSNDKMPPPDALKGYPLVIVDTPPMAGMPDKIDPDLWVVPVDNRTSIENLATVVPVMAAKAPCYVVFYRADAGGVSTLRGLQEATRHIPQIEFYDEVFPDIKAVFRTQAYYAPVWKVPHGRGTEAHRAMIRLCDAILARAGLLDDDDGGN